MRDDNQNIWRKISIEFLSIPGQHISDIKKLENRIELKRSAQTNLSVKLTDMPKGGGGAMSRLEESAVDIYDLEMELDMTKKLLVQSQKDLLSKAAYITNTEEQMVVVLRYSKQMSWNDISDMLGKSSKHARRVCGRAVDKLGEILESGKAVGKGVSL